jgi:hypothetical protein
MVQILRRREQPRTELMGEWPRWSDWSQVFARDGLSALRAEWLQGRCTG